MIGCISAVGPLIGEFRQMNRLVRVRIVNEMAIAFAPRYRNIERV